MLFSTASVKLNRIQFVACFAVFVFFHFSLFSAHLYVTESLLQFTRVSCWFNFRNHTQKNCTIAFFDRLIRKHVMHKRTQTLWPHALSNRKNWVIYITLIDRELRILTGKKHPRIKLQRLRKIPIWTFGSLAHEINSF